MAATPSYTPGSITVPKSTVRAYFTDQGVDIDAKIIDHIGRWAASVPVGTTVSVYDMLMSPDGACGCPFVFGWHSSKCTGRDHGLPIEIVLDHIFPPDGSPCRIPGVVGVPVQGLLPELSLGRPKMIKHIGTDKN